MSARARHYRNTTGSVSRPNLGLRCTESQCNLGLRCTALPRADPLHCGTFLDPRGFFGTDSPVVFCGVIAAAAGGDWLAQPACPSISEPTLLMPMSLAATVVAIDISNLLNQPTSIRRASRCRRLTTWSYTVTSWAARFKHFLCRICKVRTSRCKPTCPSRRL